MCYYVLYTEFVTIKKAEIISSLKELKICYTALSKRNNVREMISLRHTICMIIQKVFKKWSASVFMQFFDIQNIKK